MGMNSAWETYSSYFLYKLSMQIYRRPTINTRVYADWEAFRFLHLNLTISLLDLCSYTWALIYH